MKFLRKHLTTTQIITLSFLLVILLGTILLAIPPASADGTATPISDAMFTATSCVCVTGLVTVTTDRWSRRRSHCDHLSDAAWKKAVLKQPDVTWRRF